MKKNEGGVLPDTVPVPEKSRRKWKRILSICLAGVLLLWFAGALVLSPYALRSYWLPLAANLADAKMKASDLRVETLFPLRIGVKDFHYSDWNETVIDVKKASTGIHLTKLFKGTISLRNTYISNMKLSVRAQPAMNAKPPPVPPPPPTSESSEKTPLLILRHFRAENVVISLADPLNAVQQQWKIRHLQGDRFLPREKCELEAEAEVKTFPDPKKPLYINSLPFRMNAVFTLKDDYDLEAFHVELNTGIMDMVLLEDYPIPSKLGVRLQLSADGKFSDKDTFQLQKSELILFKNKQSIGQLSLSGELGKKFRCKGDVRDFNAGPMLSVLTKDKDVKLTIRHAGFHFEGHNFTEESLQSELAGELKIKAEALSFPVELDAKNRLFRLILVPLKALPAFFNIARLKLDFKKEVTACLDSINESVSGKKNLEFGKAEADLAMDRGTLTIRNIALQGEEIELESIQGKLDMPTGNLDIKTLIVFSGIKVPLDFGGTLNKPSVNLFSAIRNFLAVNAPVLKRLKDEAVKIVPKNTAVEKAIQRGLRNLDEFLSP